MNQAKPSMTAPQIVVNRHHIAQPNEAPSGLVITRAAGSGSGAVLEVWADGVKMQIFLPTAIAMNAAVGLIANAAISDEYAAQAAALAQAKGPHLGALAEIKNGGRT